VRACGAPCTHLVVDEPRVHTADRAGDSHGTVAAGSEHRPLLAPVLSREPGARSLFWRLSLVNVSVLVAVAVLLAVAPVTISVPVRPTELLIIVLGVIATAVVNLLLVRRTLAPLGQLTRMMQSVDPMEPGRRLTDVSAHDADIAALTGSFNAMLDRLELERRDSARRALSAQEHERLRIARELHDEVGQTLTAIALEAERAADAAPEADRPSWERVADWAQESVDEVRRIARELRPEALDDLGLINAFIALCNRVSAQAGIEIERRLPNHLPEHSPEIDLVVYRVAQESLTNVMRHSNASRATVSLECDDARLLLRVTDNGRGIADGERGESKTGLAGMRERAMLVGGSLTIRSEPGVGTEVELEVPLAP
jgi:two-component system, NarL family, sensor histidine kinase UhpB